VNGFISFEKLNHKDKSFIETIITPAIIKESIYRDIAIHTLVAESIEQFKLYLIDVLRNTETTFDLEKICQSVETNFDITLSDFMKDKLTYFINNIYNSLTSNQNEDKSIYMCSMCNDYNKHSLQSITIHKEGNILEDKLQNFCSVECLDAHLASAPSPNEEEMKQLELRSLIRDCLKNTFLNISTLRSISIHLLLQLQLVTIILTILFNLTATRLRKLIQTILRYHLFKLQVS
jgi:hypothetical protein